MNTAKRINEFTPKAQESFEGILWLKVDIPYNDSYSAYKGLPNIAEYQGKRFYKMSYNTDTLEACYKEAKDKPFHLRYSSY